MSQAEPGEGHFWHRTSLAANLGLSALKLVVGWLSGSAVLVADGVHSATDGIHTGAAWLGFRWAQEPPDLDHHYGHGNGEAIASVIVGVVLVLGGMVIVGGAWWWGGGVEPGYLGAAALAVTGVVIAIKLLLARALLRAGRRLNSPSLIAVGRDHRADVYSGVLVLLALAGSLAGAPWIEPVAATLLGGLVIWEGGAASKAGFDILMDRVTDPTLRPAIEATAAGVEGVQQVGPVRIHPLGSTYGIDIEVSVDATLTVAEGHEVAHRVESAIDDNHEHIEGVHVHVNPWVPAGHH